MDFLILDSFDLYTEFTVQVKKKITHKDIIRVKKVSYIQSHFNLLNL